MSEKNCFVLRCFLLVLFFCATMNSQTIQFSKFRDRMEFKVKTIALEMERLYAQRCTEKLAECPVKSYMSCWGSGEKVCKKDYPKSELCLNEGSYISSSSSVTFSPNIDYNNLSNKQKSFICSSAFLEQTFSDIQQDRNQEFGLAYFGDFNGIFRSYPGIYINANKGCTVFDPRYRPWYKAAASGGKNVIILLDSTMSSGQQLSIMKVAAKSFIRSLTQIDSIGLLEIKSSLIAHTPHLQEGTQQTLNSLSKTVQSIINSDANFTLKQILNETMYFLKMAHEREETISCHDGENFIVIFTNSDQFNTGPLEEIKTMINSYAIRINLLAMVAGANKNISFLTSLTCQFEGVVKVIKKVYSQSEMYKQMDSIHSLLSVKVRIQNPIWTYPYIDFFGYGEMMTVSMPAYYTDEGNITKLLGVVGIDILMAYLKSYHYSEYDLRVHLVTETPCLRINLTNCQLQYFRTQQSICNIQCSQTFNFNSQFCQNYSSDLYLPIVTDNTRFCCGPLLWEFFTVLFFSLFVFILIILFAFNFKKIRKFYVILKKIQKLKRDQKQKDISHSASKHKISCQEQNNIEQKFQT